MFCKTKRVEIVCLRYSTNNFIVLISMFHHAKLFYLLLSSFKNEPELV